MSGVIWKPSAEPRDLFGKDEAWLGADAGQFCQARLRGSFTASNVTGAISCQDGSGVRGVWGGTITSGSLDALARE